MNFEAARVQELRQLLVDSGLYTEEEAGALKGKAQVVFKIKELIDDGKIVIPESTELEEQEVALNDDELELETISDSGVLANDNNEEAQPRDRPNLYAPEWQDYVMSHFTEKETIELNGKKYPMVGGLRRVTELLQGEIIFSGPLNIYPATDPNDTGRASVIYEVQVAWHGGNINVDLLSALPLRTFRAAAEAYADNIHDNNFKKYPLTIAETRAEGRALRKALFLNTLAAEEIAGSETPTTETMSVVEGYNANAKASKTQVGLIESLSIQLNIDTEKFMKDLNLSLASISKKAASDAIKKLNEFQQSVESIPDKIKLEAKV